MFVCSFARRPLIYSNKGTQIIHTTPFTEHTNISDDSENEFNEDFTTNCKTEMNK